MSYPVTAKLISATTGSASVDGPDDVFGSASLSSQKSQFFASQRNYQTTSMTSKSSTLGGVGGQFNSQTGLIEKMTNVEEDSMFLAACLIIVQHKRLFRSQLRFQSAARYIICKRQHRLQQQSRQKSQICSNEVNYFGPESEPLSQTGKCSPANNQQRERMEAYAKTASVSKNKFSIVSKDDYEVWNCPPAEGESK